MVQSRAESTRDTYNYGQYINQFPPNTIKVIQEFERIQKKICWHKMSIMFNEICINEEMLPKYTYFKLHDPAAHKYNSTLEYRRDLVKRQITLCKNNIHSLNLESQKIRNKLESSITPAQLHELDNRLSVIINKSDDEHKLTLQKKLNNLYKGHLLIPNNIYKFINLSDCNLTPQQKALNKNNYRPQYNQKDIRSLIFIKKRLAWVEIKSQNTAVNIKPKRW